MRHLKATYDTVHFGFYDAILPPVLEIESGEEISVSTVSAHPDQRVHFSVKWGLRRHAIGADWIVGRQINSANIDNKELRPGTRLFLPIWVEGALFSVGDGHAAQGDGEVNQTAIETSLQGPAAAFDPVRPSDRPAIRYYARPPDDDGLQ